VELQFEIDNNSDGLMSPFIFLNSAHSSESEKVEWLEKKIERLEYRVEQSERKLSKVDEVAKDLAPLLFLFGAFCALWAQNSKRNAWLWFFIGLFFHVFAVLVLLYKNEPKT